MVSISMSNTFTGFNTDQSSVYSDQNTFFLVSLVKAPNEKRFWLW